MTQLFSFIDVKLENMFFTKPLTAPVLSDLPPLSQKATQNQPRHVQTYTSHLRASRESLWASTASAGQFPLPFPWYDKKNALTLKAFTQGCA